MNRVRYTTPAQSRGLAITLILLAVVLLAAIAASIAETSRAVNSSASTQQAKMVASAIMEQAAYFRVGFDAMQARGVDPTTITFDQASGTGLMNASTGGTVAQVPPSEAFVTLPGTPQWYYNNKVSVEGIGTSAAEGVVLLPNVTISVCQAILGKLYGGFNPTQTAAATATISNLESNATVNFDGGADANHATQNHSEGCFGDVTGNQWFYYKVMYEQ